MYDFTKLSFFNVKDKFTHKFLIYSVCFCHNYKGISPTKNRKASMKDKWNVLHRALVSKTTPPEMTLIL